MLGSYFAYFQTLIDFKFFVDIVRSDKVINFVKGSLSFIF